MRTLFDDIVDLKTSTQLPKASMQLTGSLPPFAGGNVAAQIECRDCGGLRIHEPSAAEAVPLRALGSR
jgi:hypothetical protein